MLGTLQMGSVSGMLFGPMFGGLLADAFGFQYTFIITAVSITTAAIIVLFGIKEQIRVKSKRAIIYTRKAILSGIFRHRLDVKCHGGYGNYSNRQILVFNLFFRLYVAQLTDAKDVAFLAGITFSAAGLGNLLFARFWGSLAMILAMRKSYRFFYFFPSYLSFHKHL